MDCIDAFQSKPLDQCIHKPDVSIHNRRRRATSLRMETSRRRYRFTLHNITTLIFLLFICKPTFAYNYPLGNNGQFISINAVGPNHWSSIAQAKYKAYPNGYIPTYNFTQPDFGADDMGNIDFYATGGCHGGGSAVISVPPSAYNGSAACAAVNLDGNGQSFVIGSAAGGDAEGTLTGNCQINFFSDSDCTASNWVGYMTGASQKPICNYALDENLDRLSPDKLKSFNSWCDVG